MSLNSRSLSELFITDSEGIERLFGNIGTMFLYSIDFNIAIYKKLIETLRNQGFSFMPFYDYEGNLNIDTIILRHDVDKAPQNALKFAEIQHNYGIKGSYYFRVVPESWNKNIIKQIAELGHEVGYHYEDLSFAHAKLKATGYRLPATGEELERILVDIAIERFTENLNKLKKIAPVKTICMHGSPMSRWDSRLLWKYYDYRDFGIIGEPYFDLNMESMLYLTDTGRKWNGGNVSVRDKAEGVHLRSSSYDGQRRQKAEGEDPYKEWKVKPIPGSLMNMTEKSLEFQSKYNFKHSKDIIHAIKEEKFPNRTIITFHAQRWTDKTLPWVIELVWQNVKNVGKYFIVRQKVAGNRL